MSALAPPSSSPQFPREHSITRDEYYVLADAGSFDDARVQLIEGKVIEMPPQKNPHALALTLTDYALRTAFGPGFFLRVQLPFRVSPTSEPEPDLAVITGSPRDYTDHPASAALIIEIADATLAFDRGVKARVYAAAGVSEYWIVNLVDRQLEIHRQPQVDSATGRSNYASVQTAAATDAVAPIAAPLSLVKVADLLP